MYALFQKSSSLIPIFWVRSNNANKQKHIGLPHIEEFAKLKEDAGDQRQYIAWGMRGDTHFWTLNIQGKLAILYNVWNQTMHEFVVSIGMKLGT